MKTFLSLCTIAGLLTLAITVPKSAIPISQAAVKEWVLLGERSVSDRVDHDTIPVTIARGNFHRLKITVRQHPIRILHLVVHYGNGNPDTLEIRQLIPAGGESRAIDLRGGDRVIRKIEFWYETQSLGRQPAIVRVYGIR
jgi:hypothetical protein